MTAFSTTTRQHFATIGGSHAGTETMDALALQIARLEGSFHGGIPIAGRALGEFARAGKRRGIL